MDVCTCVRAQVNTHTAHTKTKPNPLSQPTDTPNIHPSLVYQVLNVNRPAFLKGTPDPPKLWLEQLHPWSAHIGQWESPASHPIHPFYYQSDSRKD